MAEKSHSKLLLVDDDPAHHSEVDGYFCGRGFAVLAATAVDALDRYASENPDAVVLEKDLQGIDGLEICRAIRARPREGREVPVIFVAKNAALTDRIAAFESGADDFLPKPAAVEELFVRVQALLRRTKGARVDQLVAGDLVIDRVRHRVTRGGEEIPLTLTEYKLLEHLVRNKNVALSRKEILDAVWGGSVDGFTNIVDVYINYLRRKIEREGDARLIRTVRGVGYLLEAA